MKMCSQDWSQIAILSWGARTTGIKPGPNPTTFEFTAATPALYVVG
jgi:hypothetical protein